MIKQSQIHLRQKCCLVCGETYPDSVLIHKNMQDFPPLEADSGYGFCEEHRAMVNEGKVFLAEVANPPSEADKMSILSAQKTGRVLSLPREILKEILNPGFVTDSSPPFMLASEELINELIVLFDQCPTENDTVH